MITQLAQTVCGLSKTSSKNSHNSVPSFGTDQTATHGLKSIKPLTKHFNKNKPSRRKPLPSEVCQNSQKLVPMRSPCRGGATLLLASQETDGPIVGNSREKVELLSLKIPPFLPLSFSLSILIFPKPVGRAWVKIGTSDLSSHATCQILSGLWDYTLSLIHLT